MSSGFDRSHRTSHQSAHPGMTFNAPIFGFTNYVHCENGNYFGYVAGQEGAIPSDIGIRPVQHQSTSYAQSGPDYPTHSSYSGPRGATPTLASPAVNVQEGGQAAVGTITERPREQGLIFRQYDMPSPRGEIALESRPVPQNIPADVHTRAEDSSMISVSIDTVGSPSSDRRHTVFQPSMTTPSSDFDTNEDLGVPIENPSAATNIAPATSKKFDFEVKTYWRQFKRFSSRSSAKIKKSIYRSFSNQSAPGT